MEPEASHAHPEATRSQPPQLPAQHRPKSPECKAAGSRNAAKHGLASVRALLLLEDNKKQFQEPLNNFRSDYQPTEPFGTFWSFNWLLPDGGSGGSPASSPPLSPIASTTCARS
jgi:hypothetical protein